MSDRQILYLIDGTAQAYRAYFAFIKRPLINSKGEETSAPYGFTAALFKLLREYQPDLLACVFDTAAPTFRHKQFADYKATREKMPEEMVGQLPRIDQIVEALEIPILRLEGFEADDVIGTLAKQGEEAGLDVVMVSGDKDFMQLVTDHVTMLAPARTSDDWKVVDRQGVVEKFGVPPEQVTQVLGLMGDTSDNIPGVPKVGPKTATTLIQQYGTFEAVLENAADVKGKVVSENLIEFADQARLSLDLVTIRTDAPVALDLEGFTLSAIKREKVAPLFEELEFARFLDELPGGDDAASSEPEIPTDYQAISADTLGEWCTQMRLSGRFAIDTETTSLDAMQARLVGISLSAEEAVAGYIPISHQRDIESLDLEQGVHIPNVELELVHEYLGPLLADPEIVKIGQNVKYDLTILEGAGFECKGFTADTMIASYLVDPGERRHNLDRLALDLLGHEMIPIKGLIGTGQRQITFDKVGVAQAVPYACEDADYTFRIFEVLEPQLNSPELRSLFDDMEMPLVTCLLRMEQNGITLDAPFLEEMAKELTTEIERLSQEIYTHAGEQFNLNSTQQLAQILFEKLKLPYGRKTKTGYSTDETVLQDLVASGHGDRLPQLLLEYRQLSKLLSTYVEALPLLVNPNTGRVHTSFNQAVASTGRLSSSDPNLQNIPIRTEMGSRVRQAFIPREGWVLMAADYSQIELRIMAHLSGDPGLLDAFTKDEDVHTRTASAIFDLDPGFVTDDLRRQAKTVNFGLIYGQSAFGLSRQLGIAGPKAAKIIDQYFAQYPGVRGYMDRAIEQARTEGYVTTMLGRRRYIPELSQRNKNVQRAGERLAINTPIQGTAADMMKVALIAVDLDLAASDLRASMLLTVHDELVFEVHPDDVELLTELVRTNMETALELDVPVKVDFGVGNNWLDAH